MKFGENQKSRLECHQKNENQNNRQKNNFEQNFGENIFWQPDF